MFGLASKAVGKVASAASSNPAGKVAGVPCGETLAALKTMLVLLCYGILGVFGGPLYLLTEVLNAPITSVNSLFRKQFKEHDDLFFHLPILTYLFGEKREEMEEEDFILDKDVHIHSKKAFISNDEPPIRKKEELDAYRARIKEEEAKRTVNEESQYDPTNMEWFKNAIFMGPSDDYGKLRINVYKLFDHIEQLYKSDENRKENIQKIINKITDYKALIKGYLIYRSLITHTKDGKLIKENDPGNRCESYRETYEVENKETKKKVTKHKEKTIIKGQDVINVVNPFYNPRDDIGYQKKTSCILTHLNTTIEDPDCKLCCDTCTFRNSFTKVIQQYISTGAILPAIALFATGAASIPSMFSLGGIGGSSAFISMGAASEALAATAGISSTMANVILGSNSILFGAAVLYFLSPSRPEIVSKALDVYYKHVTIKIPDDSLFKTDISKITDQNIIEQLNRLTVETTFEKIKHEKDDEKKALIKKFERFMCKYEIETTIQTRIKKLYKVKTDNHKEPSDLLKFVIESEKDPKPMNEGTENPLLKTNT
jgi:hypothetical protein